MTSASTILRALAKEMDEEYERLTTVVKGESTREDNRLHGRMDILAQWACRLRTEADKHDDPQDDLIALYNQVNTIFEASYSWKMKYDLIFSAYQKSPIVIDWCDPDMSYEDDVNAFVDALEREVNP